jgi:hypothetical protein
MGDFDYFFRMNAFEQWNFCQRYPRFYNTDELRIGLNWFGLRMVWIDSEWSDLNWAPVPIAALQWCSGLISSYLV